MTMNNCVIETKPVSGEFIDMVGERYYVIRHVDRLEAFFISIVSDSDHWLFISSTGGLTAGRVSPETALFPYVSVDKIHESYTHTGSKTLIKVHLDNGCINWQPFNLEHGNESYIKRHLYKNVMGNKICFEEIHNDLNLVFRYTWESSDEYGFIRRSEIENYGDKIQNIELIDGVQNILPANTPSFAQTNSSNLVDAYKWTELDEQSGLAFFSLYAGITDRAEPSESLMANTAFCLGLDDSKVLISKEQLKKFLYGHTIQQESIKRGIRGAYFIKNHFEITPKHKKQWKIVLDIQKDQSQVSDLRQQLQNPQLLDQKIEQSITKGSNALATIMANGDGFQLTAEENVSVHHYANVLFNILRGGIFDDQYHISSHDLIRTIRFFNQSVYKRHCEFLDTLPKSLLFNELLALIEEQDDPQLERLCLEYLPITFGRRHGDPSRPWNQFAIKLKDENGDHLLSYQGNWRDIFQNWEALAFSYPEFIENVIAKFVNASTMDGYNPYRITKEGIDWEKEDPEDPWSYIGYWGDHQIIYLLKLLELSRNFHPQKLTQLLHKSVFSYANVPYHIKPLEALLKDAKNTVCFEDDLEELIEHQVATMGADGKLVLDSWGEVYLVNLFEKLLVPLLSKLGNLVIDGGIWLNTQRPEWNDANNALVGQGLSMVTLYYLRRYVRFLQDLIKNETSNVTLSKEVSQWLIDTAVVLKNQSTTMSKAALDSSQRYQALIELGQAANRYRLSVYRRDSFTGKVEQPLHQVHALLDSALSVIDHTINVNLRNDGLYHAYNLISLKDDKIEVAHLYAMLEGQVAALSSGAMSSTQAIQTIEALFTSNIYREDQHSFMLYPDRKLPGFLQKNCFNYSDIDDQPLLKEMVAKCDQRIVLKDADGCYRFNAGINNSSTLNSVLDQLISEYGDEIDTNRHSVCKLYEQVFNHQEFTGRSGTMFGFEGLGCIYWHMVSKLLLAVQENYYHALESNANSSECQQLGKLYYRVRHGIGFNKSPAEYGAFPTDPYSHTPKHAGAQQPGMTGQVKEEILTRYGELGIRVKQGEIYINPSLLRKSEFSIQPARFKYLDVNNQWQQLAIAENSLVFTWCQTPVIYQLNDTKQPSVRVVMEDDSELLLESMHLNAQLSQNIFTRNGKIKRLFVALNPQQLFQD